MKQLRVVNKELHASTTPETVVCREDEQNRILDFCKKCVKQEKAGSLFLCGCPGTGKSLSMAKVISMLVDWAKEVIILFFFRVQNFVAFMAMAYYKLRR